MLPEGSTVSIVKKRIVAKISRRKINLEATLASGQSFCWREVKPGCWTGWIAHCPCFIHRQAETYTFYSDRLSTSALRIYLQLDFPLETAIASFPEDEWLTHALTLYPGLRILRQDPWETLASFICSSVKQIVQIQAINQNLRETFGQEIEPGRFDFPDFPLLAEAGESALRACKLGFRAKHLHRTACQLVARQENLEAWHQLSTSELKQKLLALPGVGEKIADCVILFAFGRYEVFPIDVWVERVLKRLYFARARNRRTDRLRKFALDYFGPYRGYAQQYLFHWIRNHKVEPA